jgi:hypothetical protein
MALLALLSAGLDGEVGSRIQLRLGALNSAAVSWFETRAVLGYSPDLGERVRGRLGFELRADNLAAIGSYADLADPDRSEPVSLLLNEAWLGFPDALPGLSLTLGRQKVHWGTGDGVNPTDNLCAPDYSDPLVWDARRPAWLLHAEYAPVQAFGIEAAVKPVFEPALGTTTRWFSVRMLPSVDELREGIRLGLIGNGYDTATARYVAGLYNITASERLDLPRNSLENYTGGARVKTHFGSIDLSASVLRGWGFLPGYSPVVSIDSFDYRFTLAGSFPRRTAVGADFAADLAGVGLRAEAAYSLYDDSLPDDELELIAGADYSIAGFYLNAQYLRGGFPLALAAGASGAGKDYVLGTVEREFLDTRLKVRLGGAVDLRDGSYAFQPVLTVRPVSVAEVEVGAMLFGGDAGSAFAPLADNDMAFFGARFRF